ncbi:chaplin family protein [Streptomyces fagopyri]|uniref:chaplin family protein n=1 Tax=Streptomyces fagopyri TaxID=2662397 RepID=UPI003807D180
MGCGTSPRKGRTTNTAEKAALHFSSPPNGRGCRTGSALADAGAEGGGGQVPGVASGTVVQVPVNVPVNLCGGTIDVADVLNPVFGNLCAGQ